MVIGVATWELSLPECRSLKDKRRVVKSLKERMQSRFRVSVAETGSLDIWTRAELTAAVVASDGRQAESILDTLDRFVDGNSRGFIVRTERSLR